VSFLVVLVAVVGAVVLATVAGARRSSSALERFQHSSRAADLELAADLTNRQIRELRHVPGVAAVGTLRAYGLVLPSAPDYQDIGVPGDGWFGRAVDRGRLVAGRRANPKAVNEVTVGEALAKRLHLRAGDSLLAESYTPEQVASILGGAADVARGGPVLHLQVVGVVRRPLDLGDAGAPGGLLVLTPAFGQQYAGQIGVFGTRVRIRTDDGARDAPRVIRSSRHVLGQSLFNAQGLAPASQGARNAIDVVARVLWIAAAVVAFAGLVSIVIVLSREIGALGDVLRQLRDLGSTRLEVIAAATVSTTVIAIVGAPLAVAGAFALSPLFPVGVARRADPNVGLHVDWTVAGIGALMLALAILGIGLVAAVRQTRTFGDERFARVSTLADGAAAAGLRPSFTSGLRFAVDRGRGRTTLPVRSATAGAVLAVLGVTAVVVVTSNLGQLISQPIRYGAAWDFAVQDITANTPCGADDYGLSNQHSIAALTEVCVQSVELDGRPTTAMAYTRLTGPAIRPAIVAGRAPRSRHEVALGRTTLRALHKQVGDTIAVQGVARTLTYHIVGRAAFPTLRRTQLLADGVAFTGAGYAPLFDQNLFSRYFVARMANGAHRGSVSRHLEAIPQLSPTAPVTIPAEIDRLHQIDWIPVALAMLITAFAGLALGHQLVTTVQRRRRDLALLKTSGFVSRQVRATIAWQSTTLAAIGLVIGLPLGVLTGAAIWRAIARSLGIAAETTVPLGVVALIVVGAVAIANLLALWPAHQAVRVSPAAALRGE
jgi:hypothetical protein